MNKDKQIIIDGVDVSGCPHYKTGDCLISPVWCDQFYNCDYKQLKRKEQECEFSNLRIIQLQETLSQYETELDQLKRENEELKKIIVRLDVPKHVVVDMDIALENEKLRTENELLKINNAQFIKDNEFLAKRNSKLKAENEILKEKITISSNSDKKTLKIIQALTEIKEVLQFYNNSTIGVDKGNGIFEFEVSNDNVLGGKLIYHYDTNPAKEALQKISEVE